MLVVVHFPSSQTSLTKEYCLNEDDTRNASVTTEIRSDCDVSNTVMSPTLQHSKSTRSYSKPLSPVFSLDEEKSTEIDLNPLFSQRNKSSIFRAYVAATCCSCSAACCCIAASLFGPAQIKKITKF